MAVTTPAQPADTRFMSFISSTMQTTVSGFTRAPTSTNGGRPGAGERQKMPGDGASTGSPPAVSGVGVAPTAEPGVANGVPATPSGPPSAGAACGAGAAAGAGSGAESPWWAAPPVAPP